MQLELSSSTNLTDDLSDPFEEPIRSNRSSVAFVAQTNLPTARGTLRVYAFRDLVDGTEPVVLQAGPARREAVLVRVHDACFTSETLGSHRCDCKEQLDGALERIHREGGLVVYLQQEGRGIGLARKIAAYALQECGLDTVDANRALGFPDDARRYDQAADMLRYLNVESIRLMTNNPRKVVQLRAEGIPVVEQVPHHAESLSGEAAEYVQTKRDRMGHS